MYINGNKFYNRKLGRDKPPIDTDLPGFIDGFTAYHLKYLNSMVWLDVIPDI
jgi:hypothetical protein